MLKLPIGIQTFETIRKNNYLYIDKTEQILKLIENGEYYFLSRPRRFGKSLTISTLEAIFKGKTELFKGLYAEEWVKKQVSHSNPVIKIDMSGLGNYENTEEFKYALIYIIKNIANEYKLNISYDESINNNAGLIFAKIIKELSKKFGKVVVLIDEYDKPITDNINNLEKAEKMRETLRPFYSILKNCSDYLRFVFITGITKFTKTGIFSGLNNLNDISISNEFGDIVGYTQQELEDNFDEWIEKTIQNKSMSREKLLKQIKDYYDGFCFDGKTKIYNPFSILKFFYEGEFWNYWYVSGMPSFLAKYLKSHKIKEPKEYINKKISIDFINSHEIESTSVESFLFQAGYLTISKLKGNILTLDYPNEEVNSSMSCLFLEYFYNIKEYAVFSDDIWESFQEENIQKIVDIFNQAIKSIPYDDYSNRNEAWYRDLFLMLLNAERILYFAEVHTYLGRSDVVIVFEDKIFVIEFKFAKNSKEVDSQRENGKNQIKLRDYASPYLNTNKKVITAVFVADDEKKQIII